MQQSIVGFHFIMSDLLIITITVNYVFFLSVLNGLIIQYSMDFNATTSKCAGYNAREEGDDGY